MIKKIIILVLFITMSGMINAQNYKSQCHVDWNRGQQLARNHLWDRFESITKQLIKNCADELSYGTLYADLAEAQGYQNKYKESLASAEKCLSIEMQPECHLRKVLALSALGNGGVFAAKSNAILACRIVDKGSVEEIGCNRILLEFKTIPD